MPSARPIDSLASGRGAAWFYVAIVCVFCFLPEPSARGHGTDFLFAKAIVGDDGVRLEITADCEGNALVPDRSFAAAALPTALQVQIGDYRKSLVELGDIKLEERSQFDESVPLPPVTLDNSVSHQLLTALWRWKPNLDTIRFTVPKGSRLDVLLWIVDTRRPGAEPKWAVLLGGDVSPPIELADKSAPQSRKPDLRLIANFAAVILIIGGGIVLYRRRSSAPANASSPHIVPSRRRAKAG